MKAVIIDPATKIIRFHRFKKATCGDADLAAIILKEPACYYDTLPHKDTIFITEAGRLAMATVEVDPESLDMTIFGKAVIVRFMDLETVDHGNESYKSIRTVADCHSQVSHLKKRSNSILALGAKIIRSVMIPIGCAPLTRIYFHSKY